MATLDPIALLAAQQRLLEDQTTPRRNVNGNGGEPSVGKTPRSTTHRQAHKSPAKRMQGSPRINLSSPTAAAHIGLSKAELEELDKSSSSGGEEDVVGPHDQRKLQFEGLRKVPLPPKAISSALDEEARLKMAIESTNEITEEYMVVRKQLNQTMTELDPEIASRLPISDKPPLTLRDVRSKKHRAASARPLSKWHERLASNPMENLASVQKPPGVSEKQVKVMASPSYLPKRFSQGLVPRPIAATGNAGLPRERELAEIQREIEVWQRSALQSQGKFGSLLQWGVDCMEQAYAANREPKGTQTAATTSNQGVSSTFTSTSTVNGNRSGLPPLRASRHHQKGYSDDERESPIEHSDQHPASASAAKPASPIPTVSSSTWNEIAAVKSEDIMNSPGLSTLPSAVISPSSAVELGSGASTGQSGPAPSPRQRGAGALSWSTVADNLTHSHKDSRAVRKAPLEAVSGSGSLPRLESERYLKMKKSFLAGESFDPLLNSPLKAADEEPDQLRDKGDGDAPDWVVNAPHPYAEVQNLTGEAPKPSGRLVTVTACFVLDAVMCSMASHSRLWSHLRNEIFGAIFDQYPRQPLPESGKPCGQLETIPQSVLSKLSTVSEQLYETRIRLDWMTKRYILQNQAVKALEEIQERSEAERRLSTLRNVFFDWRVNAALQKRHRRVAEGFGRKPRDKILMTRLFGRWRRIVFLTKNQKILKEAEQARKEMNEIRSGINTAIATAKEKSAMEVLSLQNSLAEERDLRERQFTTYTYEISSLTDQVTELEAKLDSSLLEADRWTDLWRLVQPSLPAPVPNAMQEGLLEIQSYLNTLLLPSAPSPSASASPSLGVDGPIRPLAVPTLMVSNEVDRESAMSSPQRSDGGGGGGGGASVAGGQKSVGARSTTTLSVHNASQSVVNLAPESSQVATMDKRHALVFLKERVEKFLVDWANYQLNLVAFDRTVLAPTEDLADGEIYLALCYSIRESRRIADESLRAPNFMPSTQLAIPPYTSNAPTLVQAAKQTLHHLLSLTEETPWFPFQQPLMSFCPFAAEYLNEDKILFPYRESWCYWLLANLFVLHASNEFVHWSKQVMNASSYAAGFLLGPELGAMKPVLYRALAIRGGAEVRDSRRKSRKKSVFVTPGPTTVLSRSPGLLSSGGSEKSGAAPSVLGADPLNESHRPSISATSASTKDGAIVHFANPGEAVAGMSTPSGRPLTVQVTIPKPKAIKKKKGARTPSAGSGKSGESDPETPKKGGAGHSNPPSALKGARPSIIGQPKAPTTPSQSINEQNPLSRRRSSASVAETLKSRRSVAFAGELTWTPSKELRPGSSSARNSTTDNVSRWDLASSTGSITPRHSLSESGRDRFGSAAEAIPTVPPQSTNPRPIPQRPSSGSSGKASTTPSGAATKRAPPRKSVVNSSASGKESKGSHGTDSKRKRPAPLDETALKMSREKSESLPGAGANSNIVSATASSQRSDIGLGELPELRPSTDPGEKELSYEPYEEVEDGDPNPQAPQNARLVFEEGRRRLSMWMCMLQAIYSAVGEHKCLDLVLQLDDQQLLTGDRPTAPGGSTDPRRPTQQGGGDNESFADGMASIASGGGASLSPPQSTNERGGVSNYRPPKGLISLSHSSSGSAEGPKSTTKVGAAGKGQAKVYLDSGDSTPTPTRNKADLGGPPSRGSSVSPRPLSSSPSEND